jgi:hypothetical protein
MFLKSLDPLRGDTVWRLAAVSQSAVISLVVIDHRTAGVRA